MTCWTVICILVIFNKNVKVRINHQHDYALTFGLVESSLVALVGPMSTCVITGAGHMDTCAFQVKQKPRVCEQRCMVTWGTMWRGQTPVPSDRWWGVRWDSQQWCRAAQILTFRLSTLGVLVDAGGHG